MPYYNRQLSARPFPLADEAMLEHRPTAESLPIAAPQKKLTAVIFL